MHVEAEMRNNASARSGNNHNNNNNNNNNNNKNNNNNSNSVLTRQQSDTDLSLAAPSSSAAPAPTFVSVPTPSPLSSVASRASSLNMAALMALENVVSAAGVDARTALPELKDLEQLLKEVFLDVDESVHPVEFARSVNNNQIKQAQKIISALPTPNASDL